MLQESGGNPSAVNSTEGANGLLQWRLDRWDNLQKYAQAQGKSPTDPNVQMDFIRTEMTGPEAKAGKAFMAAPDLDSASAALRGYIRYGDNSEGTRLNNARGLYSQLTGEAPVGALKASAGVEAVPAGAAIAPQPAPAAGGGVTADAPASATGGVPGGSPWATLASGLQSMGQQAQTKPEFLDIPQLQITPARANLGGSQQIAAALAKAYGFGG